MYPPALFRSSRWIPLLLLAAVFVLTMAGPATPRPVQAAHNSAAPQPRKIADQDVTAMWLSPNGKYVVYVAYRDGQDAIWSVPVTGGSSTRLSLPVPTGTNIDYPSISPDSSRVVYAARHAGDTSKQLYSVAITGGTPTKLNHPLVGSQFVSGFQLTSDSRSVVYTVADSFSSRAYVTLHSVPLAGGIAVNLNPWLTAGELIKQYSLSRDGRYVVFDVDDAAIGSASNLKLYSVPVGGGTPVVLDTPLAVEGGNRFQFTPDSSRVVYRRKPTKTSSEELCVVPITGGTPALLASANGLAFNPYFELSSDSQYAIYNLSTVLGGRGVLWSVRLEPGEAPVPLSDPALGAGLGEITPDSKRVIYIGNRADGELSNNDNDIRSVPIAGGASISLRPSGVDSIDSEVALAPDGSRVVFRDNATDFLYSAPTDSSAPAVNLTPKLPQLARAGDLNFAHDGSRVYYLVTRDDGKLILDLRMQPATGGQAISLRGNIGTVGGLPAVVVEYNYVINADDTLAVFRGAESETSPRSLYVVDLPVSLGFRTWIPATAR